MGYELVIVEARYRVHVLLILLCVNMYMFYILHNEQFF